MKDQRLEKEFGEYFKGVNTPDDITADAKKYVKPGTSFMPKFLKFASVAASCVLVVTVAVLLLTRDSFKNDSPSSDVAESAPLYYDADITAVDADAYSLPNKPSFKFITRLASYGGAHVSDCVTYYSENELVLFNAEVEMLYGLNRYDAEMYIEFTPDKTYAPLKDYTEGEKSYYRGAEYYVTQTVADNGEPEFKLYVSYNGLKCYFDITSSDEQAYMKYLEIVVKKF